LDYAFLACRTLETQRVKEAAKRDEDRLAAVEASLAAKIGESYVAPDGKVWTVEQGTFVTQNSAGTKFSTPYRAERSMMDSISTGAWPQADRNASTRDFHTPLEAQAISPSMRGASLLAFGLL
jgi:hypothetical protein